MARSTVKSTKATKQKWGRLKTALIKWLKRPDFSSSIFRQGWEIFHWLIKLIFLLNFPTEFGRFFINLKSWLTLSFYRMSSIQYLLKRHIFYTLSKAYILEKR